MKKLLAVWLFAFTLGGCVFHESPAYKIDEVATAAAPWEVGQVVAEDPLYEYAFEYRRFLGVTTQGHYLVQEFYKDGDVKASDPYRLMRQEDVESLSMDSLLAGESFVGWYITGEKGFEITYKKGANLGTMVKWYRNGQKEYEIPLQDGKMHGQGVGWYENGQQYMEVRYQNGEVVGIWRQWDEDGNLVDESDRGSAQ